MKKWHLVVCATMTIFGGYWHGFIYAPKRWDNIPLGDLGAISIGCFIGYLLWLICVLFVAGWKDTK